MSDRNLQELKEYQEDYKIINVETTNTNSPKLLLESKHDNNVTRRYFIFDNSIFVCLEPLSEYKTRVFSNRPYEIQVTSINNDGLKEAIIVID